MRTCLVTGANAGIGKEAAVQLAAAGLLLFPRMPVDLADPEFDGRKWTVTEETGARTPRSRPAGVIVGAGTTGAERARRLLDGWRITVVGAASADRHRPDAP